MAQRKRKTKTSSKSEASKKKLENLNVVDGKAQDIAKIKELQELMGIKQANPFGVSTASELNEKMDEMNLSDLQALAVKAGLFPSGSRLTLKNKLLKEFYSTPGAGAGVDVGFQKPVANPDSPEGQDLIKLMNENL
jgi:hypothetical protein